MSVACCVCHFGEAGQDVSSVVEPFQDLEEQDEPTYISAKEVAWTVVLR